jgi:hypothetical protein
MLRKDRTTLLIRETAIHFWEILGINIDKIGLFDHLQAMAQYFDLVNHQTK